MRVYQDSPLPNTDNPILILYPGLWGGVTLILLAVALAICLVLIIRILLGKSDSIPTHKVRWVLLLLFANVFVLPVYWFKFIKNS